ncbi:uncharacterized protein OCT59_028269 [Rhizophagus irregularis]|nr:hypothetical protein OCT59_028269 [Rhizophagus irregularis]GBC43466.1 hypothetical protein GLOIN_2v1763810 [Rhizophagus irregularis DAOM 181602=DAOM 197198]
MNEAIEKKSEVIAKTPEAQAKSLVSNEDYYDVYFDEEDLKEEGSNKVKSEDDNDSSDSEEEMPDDSDDDGYNGYGGFNEYDERDTIEVIIIVMEVTKGKPPQ